ncbi:hypothetical protein SAMN05660297_02310 [Natronincola peptidivorans]|uniref:Uncharacterized protein n=1 Tax=Natronincola peptidivorans TaxID=426128 RepID=A0A1I0E6V0_9FIRM|nr:DUF6773 family protein [Natronincola peptidivorans]SET40875.1 hypothetical protein SAMN05660297_02310 [Natronincola peptidivorans]
MKSIKKWISSKIVKDERIDHDTNKIKAEAFNIIMILAFIYIIAESLSINLGVIKEFNVFILFMVGAVYLSTKSTLKGLSNYSPIKGMKPITFITLACGTASVIFGLFTAFRNTNLYLNGKFSGLSITVFVYSALYMFLLTEGACLLIYYISKKREQKNAEE